MRQLVLKHRHPNGRPSRRGLPPGAGLVVAAVASLLLWALIVGIAAIL